MRSQCFRLFLLLTPLLEASHAGADDSVAATRIWNDRGAAFTAYWTAAGCAGVVDGITFVCHSARVEPGKSASYSWVWGQTSKSFWASCMGTSDRYSAVSETWFNSGCIAMNGPSSTAPSGRYSIVNKVNGICLDPHGFDAPSGGDVGLYLCDGGVDQQFTVSANNQYLPIKNVKSGVCLDVAGYDGAANANVGLYTCEEQDDQKWKISGPTNGQTTWRTLTNKKQSLCLEAEGDARSTVNVRIAACDGSDSTAAS